MMIKIRKYPFEQIDKETRVEELQIKETEKKFRREKPYFRERNLILKRERERKRKTGF